ncbi:hypothetical protein NDU88_007086 [Pleurodeles waltl]|uniref:Uncharacterized protein n=1 Tax=Pleurodeles waltl TaxID=8319 RepID=A0AAV7SRT4_PLEWA|nr:hypothetical protein NDU88_007086 [Pleurodeles waltl]
MVAAKGLQQSIPKEGQCPGSKALAAITKATPYACPRPLNQEQETCSAGRALLVYSSLSSAKEIPAAAVLDGAVGDLRAPHDAMDK